MVLCALVVLQQPMCPVHSNAYGQTHKLNGVMMHENLTFGTHRLMRSRPTRRQPRQRLPVLVGVVHSHLGHVCEEVAALLVVVVATGAVPERLGLRSRHQLRKPPVGALLQDACDPGT